MIIEINVADEISPAIKRIIDHNPSYLRKLSKSLGWWFSQNTKKEILSGNPGGERYQERLPLDVRRKVGRGQGAKEWYGKMRRAIGYQYRNGAVVIGWTSNTAAYYGRIQEFGYKRQVTEAIRKRWAAAGYPLSKNKSELVIPKRPVFDPVTAKLESKVAPYAEEKINAYLTENVEFGKKNRRRYVVYGAN